MTIFPPHPEMPIDEAADRRLSDSANKAVVRGLRLMFDADEQLRARLARIGEDIDRILAMFANGEVIPDDRVLAVIAERRRVSDRR